MQWLLRIVSVGQRHVDRVQSLLGVLRLEMENAKLARALCETGDGRRLTMGRESVYDCRNASERVSCLAERYSIKGGDKEGGTMKIEVQ